MTQTTKCQTCDGHGMIGGFVGGAAPGYDSEPCPDCGIKSQTTGGAHADED